MSTDNASRYCAYPALNNLPSPIIEVLDALESAGFESWLVGGFVRDALRGETPHDADIATAALWEQTRDICKARGFAVYETGTAHGTITVMAHGFALEVTTYRSEGSYLDHRHPDSVTFIRSIHEDLARRDFTINAMAFHPARGLLDPFDGQNDLACEIVRCVGNPHERFNEDALRIMRALRFASQLSFQLDPATEQAVFRDAASLDYVAGQRLLTEFERFLCGKDIHRALMRYASIIFQLMPELAPMYGFDQRSRWHIYDVWEHTAYVVENTPPEPLVRWAALFHDAGKPDTFFMGNDGYGHMPGHPIKSLDHLRAAAKRLHAGRRFLHDLELLVRYHDNHLKGTRKTVVELYNNLENNEGLFHAMCDLQRADALGQAPFSHARVKVIDASEELFNKMVAAGECLTPADLAIKGNDLIELGIKQGPHIGLVLGEVFSAVTAEKIPNERDELLGYARKLIGG